MAEISILAKNLTRRYGENVVVDNIDLSVGKGEFFGFLGANGAGKSTTIRMLCGLLTPTRGTVQIAGYDVERAPLEVKRRIGVLPDDPLLYERLTAAEFLEFAARMHDLSKREALRRTNDLLSLLDLDAARDRPIADYSMGMRKKTALAAALIHRPAVLFLDEPFNGLDVSSVRIISSLLTEFTRNGGTVFFSSHLMATVELLCSRIAILSKGKLVSIGTIPEIKAQAGGNKTLEELFVQLSEIEREIKLPTWL